MCLGTSETFQTGNNGLTSGISNEMSGTHKERWTDASTGAVEVPCMLLGDLLRTHNIEHVDVFFLDVEGAEVMIVLQTFDWKIPVDMFAVEVDER